MLVIRRDHYSPQMARVILRLPFEKRVGGIRSWFRVDAYFTCSKLRYSKLRVDERRIAKHEASDDNSCEPDARKTDDAWVAAPGYDTIRVDCWHCLDSPGSVGSEACVRYLRPLVLVPVRQLSVVSQA